MANRFFRKLSTSQWVNAVMGGSALLIPAASHIADLARALGIPDSDMEAVDSDADPRTGTLLNLPAPPPPPPTPDEELAAAIEAATDFASLKAALLGKSRGGRVQGRPV